MIFDLDALHVLAADIEDTVDLRIEEGGSIVVGDGLDLALIQHQSCLDECLTVAGGAGMRDPGILRQEGIDFLDGGDRRL